MKKIRHICGLSGGKDSTALAIYLRDRIPEMEYVFSDTGKELQETYGYLDIVEAYLGKRIIRLNANRDFDHWYKVFGGFLPSPQARWCTKMLKLKPFEEFVGDTPVISYVGIRADEDRTGLISGKPNLTTVFPFKEDGIDYNGVMGILEESGIGMPPYLKWGRSHSGCYFCFYQTKFEWVQLLRNFPEDFDKAEKYEKLDQADGKNFTWIEGLPLRQLRNIDIQDRIIAEREARIAEQAAKWKGTGRLVESLGGMETHFEDNRACLICQL